MKSVAHQTKEFEANYFDDIQEIFVLTSQTTGGAGKSQQDILWTASQDIIAYVDLTNNNVINAEGLIEWLIKSDENDDPIHAFDFEAVTQYRLKVRRAKPADPKNYAYFVENNLPLPDLSHHFMLVDMLDKDIHEPSLDKLREAFLQPVIMNCELGQFELNKELKFYTADIDWLGECISMRIEYDDNSEAMSRRVAHLKTLVDHAQTIDQSMRQFAAQQLLSNAQAWQDDLDDSDDGIKLSPLCLDDFIQRIHLTDLIIEDDDGNFNAYFDDGDLFWGHVIILVGNVNGTFQDAYIAG